MTRRRNPATLASVLIAGAAAAILAVALQAGPDAGELPPVDEAAATASPEPTTAPPAEPEPEPEPEPEEPIEAVLGEVTVEDLSVTGTGLYGRGSGGDAAVPVDEAAVASFRDAMVAVVDAHLLDQQLGGVGTIDAAALVGSGEALRFLGPEQRLTSADYTVRIGARGGPEWGRVTLALQRKDGTAAVAQLVFAPGEPPILLAARK
ncbi:hypothetical protein [Egicoccus sp. AB-alg6-2]|uniref:hypothetical protein n=1 Tax=Egicoccus sp. AB-alg6-2 TaxID=3242692 RepID=UPI00359E5FBC